MTPPCCAGTSRKSHGSWAGWRGVLTHRDFHSWNLFVQDGWQVGPRLLLDYGVRYDLSTYRLPASAAVASFN
jgi:outer membrane receptor protein involved in Fe transport